MNAATTSAHYVSRIRGTFGIQLFKNSFFMILNKLVMAGSGYVFWLLAANFYSVGDVGLATGLVSAANIVLLFSYLGFDFSIIRFFKQYDQSRIFNTCMALSLSVALVLGIGYIALVRVLSPGLAFIQTPVYGAVFLGFVMVSVVGQICAITFVAARKAEWNFIQNFLLTMRLPLLIPLTFLGAFGILTSMGIAYVVVCIIILYVISRFIRIRLGIDQEFVRQSFKFSSGNYLAQILLNITYLVLPIMVLNILGPDAAAKYYIAYTMGNFLLQVPDAVGTSLFVEGSHGESMRKNVFRAAAAIYAILIPGVIFFFIFGGTLLSWFGKDYTESIELLRLFAFTSLPFAIYCLMVPILNVRMNVKRIIQINAAILVLFGGMSYLFLNWFGIVGAGFALLATYIIMDLGLVGMARVEGWI